MSEDKFLCGQSVHTDLIKKARREGALTEIDLILKWLPKVEKKMVDGLSSAMIEVIILNLKDRKRFLVGDKK